MISEGDLQQIQDVITTHVDARKIILFGSCAQESMRPDSDIDILVLVDDSVASIREIVQLLHLKLGVVVNFPFDILVEHESVFRERSALPTIERAIAREGKILYAA